MSHCRHNSLFIPGCCTNARGSLRIIPCLFETHCRHIPYIAPAVAHLLVVPFGKIHVFSSLTVVIFNYVAPAGAQVLELALGKDPVASIFTIVIFPYVVSAFAQVLEVAFGKIHVCSCFTVVIFPYVVLQLHKCQK